VPTISAIDPAVARRGYVMDDDAMPTADEQSSVRRELDPETSAGAAGLGKRGLHETLGLSIV